jgi:acetoin utilization protein AcuB
MLAKELISDEIPPLRTSDSGTRALHWMEEFKISHLPIVNKKEFLGLISDTDVLDMNQPETPLDKHRLSLIRPFVYEFNHIYEVIRIVHSLNLTIVPVLNADNQYIGSISLRNLIEKFATMSSIQDPGGILILELNINDYSLSEIARIVESNDAKILSLYITTPPESTILEVTLKINRSDLTSIIQTFERFNYTIKASHHQSEFIEDMKTRFDSFLNYLNM